MTRIAELLNQIAEKIKLFGHHEQAGDDTLYHAFSVAPCQACPDCGNFGQFEFAMIADSFHKYLVMKQHGELAAQIIFCEETKSLVSCNPPNQALVEASFDFSLKQGLWFDCEQNLDNFDKSTRETGVN